MRWARAVILSPVLIAACLDPKPVNDAVREMRGGPASKSFRISPAKRGWLAKQPWADPTRCKFLGAHEEEYFALFHCDNGDDIRLLFNIGETEKPTDAARTVHLIHAYLRHADGGVTEVPMDLR